MKEAEHADEVANRSASLIDQHTWKREPNKSLVRSRAWMAGVRQAAECRESINPKRIGR